MGCCQASPLSSLRRTPFHTSTGAPQGAAGPGRANKRGGCCSSASFGLAPRLARSSGRWGGGEEQSAEGAPSKGLVSWPANPTPLGARRTGGKPPGVRAVAMAPKRPTLPPVEEAGGDDDAMVVVGGGPCAPSEGAAAAKGRASGRGNSMANRAVSCDPCRKSKVRAMPWGWGVDWLWRRGGAWALDLQMAPRGPHSRSFPDPPMLAGPSLIDRPPNPRLVSTTIRTRPQLKCEKIFPCLRYVPLALRPRVCCASIFRVVKCPERSLLRCLQPSPI